jgi:hypothetical protein
MGCMETRSMIRIFKKMILENMKKKYSISCGPADLLEPDWIV